LRAIAIALGAAAVLACAANAQAQQGQNFETLVEQALERAGEPAGTPAPQGPAVLPDLATPPQPVPGGPAVLPDLGAPAAPPSAAPSLVPPAAPAPSPPPEAAPRTLPPPAPPASGPVPGQAAEPPARGMESLRPEEVNAATYQEHADVIRGASPLILKLQVLLDRNNASPGVIDGYYGDNVAKAIAAMESVLGLPVDGQLDPDVWKALGGESARPPLMEYVITPEDVAGPFLPEVPKDFAEMAKLETVAYTGPLEMFGERFHMDVRLLKALNPGADLAAPGTRIMVADVKSEKIHGKIARIEADKARRQIRAYDDKDWLIVAYPATIGSEDNPSPSGDHRIDAIAPNPVYYYNPKKNFQQGKNDKPLEIPPGPNNPVGTMWIDLSEPSYGIHGTPEPSKIDKTGSHGCIRLTNWDVEELAKIVEPGIIVSFIQ
jgi:lipoprotein-anchoring transpeptidase ErfK/SrfK